MQIKQNARQLSILYSEMSTLFFAECAVNERLAKDIADSKNQVN